MFSDSPAMPASGMQLPRPYQDDGIRFLASRRHALLAFDTRMGKTLVALRAARKIDAKRVLVLAPAIGRLSWAEEIPKVGTFVSHIPRAGAGPDTVRKMPDLGAPHVLVLSYDTLSNDRHGWVEFLASRQWDVLILDEAQFLKAAGSNRTKACYGRIAPACAVVWLLSGTPTPNHAGELYPHIAALWPKLLPGQRSRHEFEDQYCVVDNGPWGRSIRGSRNQDELRDKLAPYVLRRRKHEVFTDLPKVANNLVPIETDAPPVRVHVSELDRLLASPVSEGARSLQRALGEAKMSGASLWLREQLGNDIIRKIVVFAWHKTVLDYLQLALADFHPVRIDGGTPTIQRQAAVHYFQTSDRCRVFIGQTRAAGTAICLDAADDVAIVEPSWTPMENYQAASRVENLGQRKAVTVSWLTTPDPLDRQIMAVLARKSAQIAAIWD